MSRAAHPIKSLLIKRKGKPINIGTSSFGGEISIPAEARAAHMHVIGRSRSGKSRFLADLIRQDIVSNRGLCLIDPHGELYELTTDWLAGNTVGKVAAQFNKNIHPVDLSDLDTTFRYNPLHVDSPDEAYGVASNVVDAIGKIFGAKNPNDTPLTAEIMTMVCVILAQNHLPLAAAHYLLYQKHEDIAKKITEGAQSEWHRDLAEELRRKRPKEFAEAIASTRRRFEPFIANPQVARIFSTTENTVQLKDVMDDGHMLLFDLRRKGKVVDSRVLKAFGIFLTNQFYATSFEREPRSKPRPFNLYIDEVQNFISDDIEEILSQCAKFGLFLTLSHQHLGQLKEAGELVTSGVMSGTLMKAIFAQSMEHAPVFADELFSGEIDFERVKEKITTPTTVGYELMQLRNQSKMEGKSRAEAKGVTEAEASSSGTSVGGATNNLSSSGETVSMSPGMDELGVSEFSASAVGDSSSYSEIEVSVSSTAQSQTVSHGENVNITKGISEALRPIIQERATQTYTLEEQRYGFARDIANLPKRHGFFFIRGQGVMGFKTRDIPDEPNLPIARKNLLSRLIQQSLWLTPTKDLKLTYLAVAEESLEELPADFMEPDEDD